MDVQEIWGEDSVPYLVYTFEVTEAWKGAKEDRLVVWTLNGTSGSSFEIGKEYLVFASQVEEGLYTSDCTGNKPIEEAQRDLRQLGRPRKRFPAGAS